MGTSRGRAGRWAMWAVLAAGCSSGGGAGAPGEARSALARDTAPDVAAADQGELVAGGNAFAFDLYHAVAASPANLAASPYSISLAMAMSWAGARGTTADEIAAGLHFTLPSDRLHPAFDWLDLALASRADAQTGTGARPFALKVAAALFDKPNDSIEKPFLDTLALDYGAGVELVDFAADPAASTRTVNAWVSGQTNGRITEVLPPGEVDGNTHLVLVDALYFDASWMQPFDARSTAPGAFTRGDGQVVSPPMMSQQAGHPYTSTADYQAVELGYAGGQVALDVVLPANAAFEAGLTADGFAAIVQGLQPTMVGLTLPKFRLAGASIRLTSALEALGVHAAFDPSQADFTGITAAGGIYIKDVLHQAFVDVDEDGTEAAAATAVVYEDGSVAADVVPMVVNRPFFFAIRDLPTGAILFVGHVEDPTASM